MKLISKYKDYYDYLQGIYGIDEKIVYDRRAKFLSRPDLYIKDDYKKYIFAICNRLFVVYYYQDKFYHTPEEILEFDMKLTEDKKNSILLGYGRYLRKRLPLIEQAKDHYERENIETNVNKITRQPVLIKCGNFEDSEFSAPITIVYDSYFGKYNKDEKAKWNIPLLSEYNMAAFYPAEQIYQDISQFLGWLVDNPSLPNNQTNENKIISHGFDLKKSFRNRNKL